MLNGETAVVSGASRGIGRATALRLARAGANVLIHASTDAALGPLADEIRALGGTVAVSAGDVADPKTAEAAVATAQEAFGSVSILVNNAGITARTDTLNMPLADWQRVLDVNLNGTFHFCRAVLPGMIAHGGGRIVNVSSTAAKTPNNNNSPAYGASKAAVNYLTMHLAREMAPHGVRVNAVCPGPIETDMTGTWTAEQRDAAVAGIPLHRLGTGDEVADTVLFLASEMSTFITGATLNVNGGKLMG